MYIYDKDHIRKLRKENGYTMAYVADNIDCLKSLYPTMGLNELFNYKLK